MPGKPARRGSRSSVSVLQPSVFQPSAIELHRAIAIANRHPRLGLDRRAVARVIHALDAHAARFRGGCPPGELSLVFLPDAALARLHADFMGDPTTTDVITFSGDPAAGLAGEICVSADAAQRHVNSFVAPASAGIRKNPAEAGTTNSSAKRLAARFSRELTLYLVHGWLHLAGYDDLEPAKKRVMRRAESRALALLRHAAALPHFAWRR